MKSLYKVEDNAPIRYAKENLQCYILLSIVGPKGSHKLPENITGTAKNIGYPLQPHVRSLIVEDTTSLLH